MSYIYYLCTALISLPVDTDADPGGDDSGSKLKSPRVVPPVVWEWEGDGGKLNAYTLEHSQLLTDALVRGDPDVTLKMTRTVKMRICFEAMTQTNIGTGWQSNVRCLPSSVSTTNVCLVWEFHDKPEDSWTAYSAPTQYHLEACYLCGVESVKVESTAGMWCVVDLKAMKQVEERSGKTRKIRRSETIGDWIHFTSVADLNRV